MRVYLPSSPGLLREAVQRGELGPGPLDGHAVTPGLAAALGTSDEEELELAAMSMASLDSVRRLAATDPAARVVAVVDVPDREVRAVTEATDDADVTAVVVDGAVPLRRLAAVHVDSAEASDAVAAARAVAPDDPAEEEALARCLDHDLEWYAASELTQLLERWAPPG